MVNIQNKRKRNKIWQKENADKHRNNQNKYRKKIRLNLLELLGNKCTECGFNDIRALQIDHINGGGNKEIKKIYGVGYLLKVTKSLLNDENKYQLLCANCNWIKRYTNNESLGRPRINI